MASKPLRAVGDLPGPQRVAVTSQDRAEVPTGDSRTCSVGGNAPWGSHYGRRPAPRPSVNFMLNWRSHQQSRVWLSPHEIQDVHTD